MGEKMVPPDVGIQTTLRAGEFGRGVEGAARRGAPAVRLRPTRDRA